jgi:hypothetical protein
MPQLWPSSPSWSEPAPPPPPPPPPPTFDDAPEADGSAEAAASPSDPPQWSPPEAGRRLHGRAFYGPQPAQGD